jgi:hypothetical protein
MVRGCSSGGPQAVSEESSAEIVSDTERIKNTHIHVCAKTAFVGWLIARKGPVYAGAQYRPLYFTPAYTNMYYIH